MQQCESTALPGNLGVRVDCFMTRGYLTGKRLRTPVLDHKMHVAIYSNGPSAPPFRRPC